MNDNELDDDPGDVEEVELPSEGVHSERVHVGVEGAAGTREEPEQGHALCSKTVRENLDN